MRRALIIGNLPNGATAVVARPGVPRQVRDQFIEILTEGGRGYSAIELWVSDVGVTKRKKFDASEPGDEQSLEFEGEEGAETAALLAEIAKLREDLKVTSGLLETAETENASLVAERDALRAAAAEAPPKDPPKE